MKEEKYNYNGVDLFKFFFAFCVIACHIHPYGVEEYKIFSIYNFLDTILNAAVPFFFIASGFFMARKLKSPISHKENMKVILGILKKYLVLYLVWTLIYLPITIYHYINSEASPLGIAFDFLNGMFFTGQHWYSWHLWYMCSLIWALILLYFGARFKISDWVIFLLASVLFIFAFVYGHFLSSGDNCSLNYLEQSLEPQEGNLRHLYIW